MDESDDFIDYIPDVSQIRSMRAEAQEKKFAGYDRIPDYSFYYIIIIIFLLIIIIYIFINATNNRPKDKN